MRPFSFLGQGVKFEALWTLPLDGALSQNRRGSGFSETGMVNDFMGRRALLKRQQHYVCRPVWRAFRATPTFLREARFQKIAARAGVNVAVLLHVELGSDGRMIIASAWIDDAVSLREAQGNALRAAAEQFVRLHRARICHGALYDLHVLVGADDVITLIDFEKARRRLSSSLAAIGDLKRFIRRAAWITPAQIDLIISAYPWRDFPLLRVWARFWR